MKKEREKDKCFTSILRRVFVCLLCKTEEEEEEES